MQEGLVTVAGAYAMIIVVVVVTLNIVLNLITAKRARRLNPVHTEAGN
jgi:hypothetical protein